MLQDPGFAQKVADIQSIVKNQGKYIIINNLPLHIAPEVTLAGVAELLHKNPNTIIDTTVSLLLEVMPNGTFTFSGNTRGKKYQENTENSTELLNDALSAIITSNYRLFNTSGFIKKYQEKLGTPYFLSFSKKQIALKTLVRIEILKKLEQQLSQNIVLDDNVETDTAKFALGEENPALSVHRIREQLLNRLLQVLNS